jgi:hypothetical protein
MTHIEPKLPLDELDPGSRDPRYWDRFHRTVMSAAAPGLAQRAARGPSLEDVLLSWSRLLVPTAVAAAALAGLFLVSEPGTGEPIVLAGVEEMLTTGGVDDEVELLPDFLLDETVDDLDAAMFAATAF